MTLAIERPPVIEVAPPIPIVPVMVTPNVLHIGDADAVEWFADDPASVAVARAAFDQAVRSRVVYVPDADGGYTQIKTFNPDAAVIFATVPLAGG